MTKIKRTKREILIYSLVAWIGGIVGLIGATITLPIIYSYAGNDGLIEVIDDEGNIVGTYTDITNALSVTNDKYTLKLLSDITVDNGVLIDGKTITIDGDGYTLTRSGDFTMFTINENATGIFNNITIVDNAENFYPDRETSYAYTGLDYAYIELILNGDMIKSHPQIISKGVILGDNLTIENSLSSASAGGIAIESGIIVMNNSNFIHNGTTKTSEGGAISLGSKSISASLVDMPIRNVEFKNCNFESNYARGGGAINFKHSHNLIIDSCIFSGNSARGDGGAILLSPGNIGRNAEVPQMLVTGTLFFSNWCGNDGFAIENDISDAQIINTKFIKNIGPAQRQSVGTYSIKNKAPNTYVYNGNTKVDVKYRTKHEFENCIFQENEGGCPGIGDHGGNGYLVVKNTNFINNIGSAVGDGEEILSMHGLSGTLFENIYMTGNEARSYTQRGSNIIFSKDKVKKDNKHLIFVRIDTLSDSCSYPSCTPIVIVKDINVGINSYIIGLDYNKTYTQGPTIKEGKVIIEGHNTGQIGILDTDIYVDGEVYGNIYGGADSSSSYYGYQTHCPQITKGLNGKVIPSNGSISKLGGISINCHSEYSIITGEAPNYIDTEGNIFEMQSLTYSNGYHTFTILDRNLGATGYGRIQDNNDGNDMTDFTGYLFQGGNNYGFKSLDIYNTNYFADTTQYSRENPYVSSIEYGFDTRQKDPFLTTFNVNLRGGSGDITSSDNNHYIMKEINPDYMRQGPCPEGFHVPRKSELDLLSLIVGPILKSGMNYMSSTPYIPGIYDDPDIKNGKYYAVNTPSIGYSSKTKNTNGVVRCFKDNYSEDEIQLTLSFDTMGGLPMQGQTVLSGNTAHVPGYFPGSDRGYILMGWYKDRDYNEEFLFGEDILTQNTTIYAKYECDLGYTKRETGVCEPNEYNIIYDTDGGNVDQKIYTVSFNAEILLPAIEKSGHYFLGWFTAPGKGGDFVGKPGDTYIHNIPDDTILYAHWIKGEQIYSYGKMAVIRGDAPNYIDTEGNIFEMKSLTLVSGSDTIKILDRNLGAIKFGTGMDIPLIECSDNTSYCYSYWEDDGYNSLAECENDAIRYGFGIESCMGYKGLGYQDKTSCRKGERNKYESCLESKYILNSGLISQYGYLFQLGNNYGFDPRDVFTGINDKPNYDENIVDLSGYSWQYPYINSRISKITGYNATLWGTEGEARKCKDKGDDGRHCINYDTERVLNPDYWKQGPCPEGYHIPNRYELSKLTTIMGSYSKIYTGAGGLFMPMLQSPRLSNLAGVLKSSFFLSTPDTYSYNYQFMVTGDGFHITNGQVTAYSQFNYLRCFADSDDVDEVVLSYATESGLPMQGQTTQKNGVAHEPGYYPGELKEGEIVKRYYDKQYQREFTFFEDVLTGNTTIYAKIACLTGYSMVGKTCINDDNKNNTGNNNTGNNNIGSLIYQTGNIVYTGVNGEIFTGIGTISISDGQTTITMMDRNLGATTTDINDTGSYGYHFQRGNNRGFKPCYTNSCNTFYNGEIIETGQKFIVDYGYNSGVFVVGDSMDSWMTGLLYPWGGEEDREGNDYGYGINNENRQGPCPEGWHIPSIGEWNKIMKMTENLHNYAPIDNIRTIAIYQQDYLFPFNGYRTYNSNITNLNYEGILRASPAYYNDKGESFSTYFVLMKNQSAFSFSADGRYSNAYGIRCFKNDYEISSGYAKINYETNGGTKIYPQLVRLGNKGNSPTQITKKDGFVFAGRYEDQNFTKLFNFDNTIITGDISIYAKWLEKEMFVQYHTGNIIYTGSNGEIFTGIGTISVSDETMTITMMDRNLGARSNNINDASSHGYIFQRGNNRGFNENDDYITGNEQVDIRDYILDHKYSQNLFIIGHDNWTTGSNIDLWGGDQDSYYGNGGFMINNENRQGPCPEGWHIPSAGEWTRVSTMIKRQYLNNNVSLDGNDIASLIEENFLLPNNIIRSYWTSTRAYGGKYLRSSSQWYNTKGRVLLHNGGTATSNLSDGLAVRCFKNDYEINSGYAVIQFESNGGILRQGPIVMKLGMGGKITQPQAPMKTGYVFVGWYTDIDLTNLYNFDNIVTGNLILYAKYDSNVTRALTEIKKGGDFQPVIKGGTTITNINDENLYEGLTGDDIQSSGNDMLIIVSDEGKVQITTLISEEMTGELTGELTDDIERISGGSIDLNGGLTVFIKATILSGDTVELVKKSINTIQFSHPIAIPIPVDLETGFVKIKVKHSGDEPFGVTGLTLNPEAGCISGTVLSGDDQYDGSPVEINSGYVWIYTCSASTFVAYTENNKTVYYGSSSKKRKKVEDEVKVTISDNAKSIYNQEQLDAYKWAYKNGITTIDDADRARLSDSLTRAELAKMMSQYIGKILNKKVESTLPIEYQDVDDSLGDLASYIKIAYWYKIMGINGDGTPLENFNPYGKVSRAELATVFSRVLFGDKYNKTEGYYYEDHIAILKKVGILKNTNPTIEEVRGWVMLMMYRSAK